MELAFETRELRDICEIEAEAQKCLGAEVAEMLKRRLADLDAATSPNDLVAGHPQLSEDKGTMLLQLSAGFRIVFTPNHPSKARESVDWSGVSRIRILRIERDDGCDETVLP